MASRGGIATGVTGADVMAELDDDRGMSAEEQVLSAREALRGPNVAQEAEPAVPEIAETLHLQQALYRTRTDDPFLTMEVLYQLS
jgi:hypothetical protein